MGSSQFLLLFLPPRQICNGFNTRIPASAHNKILHLDKLLVSRQIASRRCASACPYICKGDKSVAPINLVPRHG